jgi:hypothetical protein
VIQLNLIPGCGKARTLCLLSDIERPARRFSLVTKPEQGSPCCDDSAKAVYNPAPLLDPNFLPLDWALDPTKDPTDRLDRILAELTWKAAHEPNAHLADDYRQAMVAIILAAKGKSVPFVESSYICYGLHPDKVYQAIIERRKALLGPLYDEVERSSGSQVGLRAAPTGKPHPPETGDGLSLPEQFPSPKKPVQSVRRLPRERKAA